MSYYFDTHWDAQDKSPVEEDQGLETNAKEYVFVHNEEWRAVSAELLAAERIGSRRSNPRINIITRLLPIYVYLTVSFVFFIVFIWNIISGSLFYIESTFLIALFSLMYGVGLAVSPRKY